jgi:hypothetical protein
MAGKLVSKPSDAVFYVYGITQYIPSALPVTMGVDGASPVEPIECFGLTCWTSRVAKSDFADQLSRNMENLDWLSEKSVAHQAAVQAIAKFEDILPARFGTVFLTQDSLRADIKKRKREILADFERIEGSDEWGVKVFMLTPKTLAQTSPVLTGKDYLQAKSQVLRSKGPLKADEQIDRFDSEMRKTAVDSAPAGTISGGRRDLVYRISLLVKRSDRKRFEAVLGRFSTEWQGERLIECTGPWPPYSFVSRGPE